MRWAYSDPPYPGLSRRYYGDHRDFDGEVDHQELLERLTTGPYDGWALSTSSAALRDVWALCPVDTRLYIWVNGPRHVKAYEPLRAYEAVLIWGARPRVEPVVEDLCDVLRWGGRQHSFPGALTGMKPAVFSDWLFRVLGVCRGDTLDDLFRGSGAVSRAWEVFMRDDAEGSQAGAQRLLAA